ncbi:FAD-dependent oxidoreductase [Conexibacter woesei]|uniref:ferredoxin--NADP(+) reductase n=1 Tax=Conexibacter woesei (strain DSM 14684 / CCUG 47730 / CIP 108061 / JCM 11494 / NBRC 100937 / ID131577) TaxID=469383 RepID=D3F3A1_CONWI|nr:FAD-dependent oxidoreductase [Conexibacter woesei]ADB50381.1 FAD-dependent pyridine nucleotide-disulphide oxidoreductase [Conexibacter woesei DSM 14684]
MTPLRVAIVGSGPAGFYAADQLLAAGELDATVDVFDRLPTPWGLVRAGVSPDHPKIKAVAGRYEKTAARDGFRFFGNVDVGRDVPVEELRAHYHAVIYAVGASADRSMGIPGEELPGSHSASHVVGWYNGHPDFADHQLDLAATTAVVIGNGNVAIDVARMLSQPRETLARTDVADHALDALGSSSIEQVVVLGRRGPAHAAFTTPGLIELSTVDGLDVLVDPADLQPDGTSESAVAADDPLLATKLAALRCYVASESHGAGGPGRRRMTLRFFAAPLEIVGDGRVEGVRVARTAIVADDDGRLRAVATEQEETIPCQLVVRAVGYRGRPLPGLPFDERSATIPNVRGRVVDGPGGAPLPGDYVSGWIKRGPSGVIGTSRKDSQETVDALLEDLAAGKLPDPSVEDADAIVRLLAERAPEHVTYAGWQAIDAAERAAGEPLGRPRVKFVRTRHLLDAAGRELTRNSG